MESGVSLDGRVVGDVPSPIEASAADEPAVPTILERPASSPIDGRTADKPAPASAAGAQAGASPGQYPKPASDPTQAGSDGIRFDFNEGCRLSLPPREHGVWRARLSDLDTGNVLFETETSGGTIRSSKRWFVRFSIEVWSVEGGAAEAQLAFAHEYDASDRTVLIHFPVGTLGDSIAWFSYASRFGERHRGARVVCVMSALLIPLFRDAYPDIMFVSQEEAAERNLTETAYATYYMGLFFTDVACEWQPADFRHVGLHKTAACILGLDPAAEQAPRIRLPDESRPIGEPYAVIAVQATSAAKLWNNPDGWRTVIAFLKARGLRVICIDQKPAVGQGYFWNQIPHGCEDFTGISLLEAARYLRHAEIFVGLSSGLSWLAWAAGCKTTLISGFSLPSTEFATPGRVTNWHTCNGCWNDPGFVFDHTNFFWCPRQAGTARQFECTRLITPAHVTRTIEKLIPQNAENDPALR